MKKQLFHSLRVDRIGKNRWRFKTEEMDTKPGSAAWNSFDQNNNSGKIRVTSEAGDPLKGISIGLYGIAFVSFKNGAF